MHTVKPIEGSLYNDEWEKLKPELLCIDASGWRAIKENWLKACVLSGKNCNVQIQTIDQIVRQLDAIAKQVYGGK